MDHHRRYRVEYLAGLPYRVVDSFRCEGSLADALTEGSFFFERAQREYRAEDFRVIDTVAPEAQFHD